MIVLYLHAYNQVGYGFFPPDEDFPVAGPSRYSMTEKAEQVLNVPPKDSAATSSVNTTEVDKNLKATSLEKKGDFCF